MCVPRMVIRNVSDVSDVSDVARATKIDNFARDIFRCVCRGEASDATNASNDYILMYVEKLAGITSSESLDGKKHAPNRQ